MSITNNFNDILKGKKDALSKLSSLIRSEIHDSYFIWSEGRYLILHYDLITIDEKGNELDREDAYKLISEYVEEICGFMISESVYILRLFKDKSSEYSAYLHWNNLKKNTKGKLKVGDSIFIHYAPDTMNHLGGIAEIIKNNEMSKLKSPNN